MKRFSVGILILILVSLTGFADQYSEKKSVKLRWDFSINHKHISSQFNPQNWNLSLNSDPTPGDPMDDWDISEVICNPFLNGSGFRWAIIGFGSHMERAYAYVFNPYFSCKEGDTFTLWGFRGLSLQESGSKFSGSIDVRIIKDLWLSLAYSQSRKLAVNMAENQEFAAIDELKEYSRSSNGIIWFMWLSRHFNEQTRVINFRNRNFEFSLKYDLLGSDRFDFSPLLGVGLWISQREESGKIKEYKYQHCFLPEEFSEEFYNNAPIESFRRLTNENKIERSDSKLNYRIFAGCEMEFYPLESLGIYGAIKVYNKSPLVIFNNESWYGNFPIDLRLDKTVISLGLVFKF